jgi:hypothetical protein
MYWSIENYASTTCTKLNAKLNFHKFETNMNYINIYEFEPIRNYIHGRKYIATWCVGFGG